MAARSLNLIPAGELRRLELRRRARRWIRAGVAVACLAGLSRFLLAGAVEGDRAAHQRAAARAGEARAVERALAASSAERDHLAELVLERDAVLPRGSLLDLFAALDAAMPGELYLVSLAAGPAAGSNSAAVFDVQLEGNAPSTDAVASFLFHLGGREGIDSTQVEMSRRDDAGARGVAFSVKLRYDVNAATQAGGARDGAPL